MSQTNTVTITDAPAPPPADSPAPVQPNAQQSNVDDASGQDFVPHEVAIRENAKRADDMIRELAERARQNDQRPSEAPNPQTDQRPPPETPPVPDAQMAALQTQLAAAQNEASTWRGRHTAETTRLNEEIATLRRQIAELATKKAKDGLTEALANVPSATPEEIETYGQEMLDVAARYVMPQVRQLLESGLAAIRAEMSESLAPVRQRVETAEASVKETAAERFQLALDNSVKGWRALDTDPAFLSWLDGADPLFGSSRRNALDTAVANLDAKRVAAFFTAYLDQRGGGTGQVHAGQPASPAAPDDQGSGADAKMSLADFAAPGGTRAPGQAADSVAPSSVKRWTRQEIAAFYARLGRGEYKHDRATAERVERDIARAQREGRVVD